MGQAPPGRVTEPAYNTFRPELSEATAFEVTGPESPRGSPVALAGRAATDALPRLLSGGAPFQILLACRTVTHR